MTALARALADRSGSVIVSAAGVTWAQQWYHLAFVRSGTTFYVFRDGVLLASQGSVTGAFTNFATPLWIGNDRNGPAVLGHMSEVRITKGVARWTTAFTPPVAPYPDYM